MECVCNARFNTIQHPPPPTTFTQYLHSEPDKQEKSIAKSNLVTQQSQPCILEQSDDSDNNHIIKPGVSVLYGTTPM